jgi:hypothetical protein
VADTIRSLSELNALFADNGQGNITPQDIRDLMVSMMVHGEIGSGPKASITLVNGWNALDLDVAGAVGRGLTIDTTNKVISAVPVIMKAWIDCEVWFKGTNGQNYDFAVWRNPSGTPDRLTRLDRTVRVSSATGTFGHRWSTAQQLQVNDVLQLAVNSFELLFGLLRVTRIGIE